MDINCTECRLTLIPCQPIYMFMFEMSAIYIITTVPNFLPQFSSTLTLLRIIKHLTATDL